MAYNSDIHVRELEKYAEKLGFSQCVMVGIKSNGQYAVITWGENKYLCEQTKKWGSVCEKAIMKHYTKGE